MRRTLSLLLMLLCLTGLPATRAEIGGTLTQELAGTEVTYHYTSGRKYHVRFSADTMAYLRFDVEGRDWVEGVPYIARKIDEGVYYVNWHRPDRVEFVTILYDFNKRVMYTSALLEGTDRHFDVADIVELKRGGG